MIAIEHQLHDVLLRHLRQLPAEDVLEVEEFTHTLVLLIVTNHHELDDTLVLFVFGALIPIGESQARRLR